MLYKPLQTHEMRRREGVVLTKITLEDEYSPGEKVPKLDPVNRRPCLQGLVILTRTSDHLYKYAERLWVTLVKRFNEATSPLAKCHDLTVVEASYFWSRWTHSSSEAEFLS